ncbi:hypothetical protein H4Q26_017387 [Puccinia striiformis f. sp. tritici PST-130]|nr:hypothetical protein H4Q26_017387 [Puccinia striiformis f. sp. tritici PST-130]
MQAKIILSCLAFLAISHQAISTEGPAVTEVVKEVQEATKAPRKCCGGCGGGKKAEALDLNQIKAALPVESEAGAVEPEAVKTTPVFETKGEASQATPTVENEEESTETKPKVETNEETSENTPTNTIEAEEGATKVAYKKDT